MGANHMEANHMGAKGKFFTCGLGHMRSNHMGATHSLGDWAPVITSPLMPDTFASPPTRRRGAEGGGFAAWAETRGFDGCDGPDAVVEFRSSCWAAAIEAEDAPRLKPVGGGPTSPRGCPGASSSSSSAHLGAARGPDTGPRALQ